METFNTKDLARQHIERTFSAASTFMSGIVAISMTQMLAAPFKTMNPKFYKSYMSFTKESFGVLITTLTEWWSPTVVHVSGDSSIPGQLFKRANGTLQCKFPKRLILMANHQLYTDWLYLWWAAYTNDMHGHIYIILKESLKKVPIIGWGCQFYNFIFLARDWEQDKVRFQSQLKPLKNANDPMWLLIFPEGTNLSSNTRQRSAKWAKEKGLEDMGHQLLPRSRGLQFCLQNLSKSTHWLYDCTLAYSGVLPNQYGQDVYTLQSSLFEGRPPKSVHMHFRRFRISSIPFDDDIAFGTWLLNRWREKDYLLEHFARFESFPKDVSWLSKQQNNGKIRATPAASIATQIKSNNVDEFLSIFAPLASIVMVLIALNGGGDPSALMNVIQETARRSRNKTKDLQAVGIGPANFREIESWVAQTQQTQESQQTKARRPSSTRSNTTAQTSPSIVSSLTSTIPSQANARSIAIDRQTLERTKAGTALTKLLAKPASAGNSKDVSGRTLGKSKVSVFRIDRSAFQKLRASTENPRIKSLGSSSTPESFTQARPPLHPVQVSPEVLKRMKRAKSPKDRAVSSA